MLNYLVDSNSQIMTMMIMIGMIFAYEKCAYNTKVSILTMRFSLLAGLIMAGVLTFYKNTTRTFDNQMWNMGVFAVTAAMLVLFLVFALIGRKKPRFGQWAVSLVLAVENAVLLLYFLPPLFDMPRAMLLAEQTILSSDFLLKLICFGAGILLTFLAGLAVFKILYALGTGMSLVFMVIALLLNTCKNLAATFGILLTKRLIGNNHTLFVISRNSANYSDIYIYAALALCLVAALILLVRSLHVNEPYSNPAQHRKIRAKWRNRRRWIALEIICVLCSVLTMTVLYNIANQEVELSPIEDAAKVDDTAVYVSFDQVSDGHLHRFGYESPDGTVIRFIVIQKPNSSSYGIGLDACDICGETGYYEKNGQVVCNLCDVVMNINTIGFKGGCNPIVIDYSIENGYIIVPIEGLLEYEKEFK